MRKIEGYESLTDEEKVKVLDEVYKEILESNQDSGSKREAAAYNRKLHGDLITKINKKD